MGVGAAVTRWRRGGRPRRRRRERRGKGHGDGDGHGAGEDHEIIIAQDEEEENVMRVEVILERPEEPQKESKEERHLVLVKPPTLPCIFSKPYKGVEIKECSQIFYTADTFVLDDHDATKSLVLEVSNELPSLKEGVHVALPKAIDAPFVVDISKGEGIT
ncbi:hypothetical protein Scep_004857 [Stephania cephalantha]|uniref:Uncharacterized protein n=1 Tax=Stephania cephalantha TaxID=152367 RepID=A0AAP0KUM0_9MAGN